MIADPWFYPVAVVAMLLVGISKGGFGGGLGMLGVPLMSLLIDPITAAAIMLPVLCVMDLFGLWAYRRVWDARNLVVLAPAALIGILAGSLTFRHLDVDLLRLLIGLLAVGFAAHHYRGVWRRRRGGAAPRARRASLPLGLLAGSASGFTSFVAHAGGPPLSVYLLGQRLDKTVFVGTTVVFFTLVNYVKLVPYALLGQLHAGNLLTALVLLPLAPAGIYLGIWLHRRVSEERFYGVVYLFLALTGLKLIYDGVAGLAVG